jgi:sulfur relay protein TusB/DsrH
MSGIDTSCADEPCLHLLLSSQASALQACLDHCARGDTVVLLNTAVELLLGSMDWAKKDIGLKIQVLEPDLLAHGMQGITPGAQVELIDDIAWVGLVAAHKHCLSWK